MKYIVFFKAILLLNTVFALPTRDLTLESIEKRHVEEVLFGNDSEPFNIENSFEKKHDLIPPYIFPSRKMSLDESQPVEKISLDSPQLNNFQNGFDIQFNFNPPSLFSYPQMPPVFLSFENPAFIFELNGMMATPPPVIDYFEGYGRPAYFIY
jgi:hypothetical protein